MTLKARLATASILALIVSACGGETAQTVPEEQIVEIPEEEVFTEVETGLAEAPSVVNVLVPEVNARRGRILFTVKGCVICHQVNGVGGLAAPDLSTSRNLDSINPLEFSARMWTGAEAMTALQSAELGYTIELDEQDIADLAAFSASKDEQDLFTIEAVGEEMRTWFLNDRNWASGNWDEYKSRGLNIPQPEEE